MAKRVFAILLGAFVLFGLVSAAGGESLATPLLAPVGTGFTYQGYLEDGGLPANADYDFEFRLYDASVAGSQVTSPVALENVAVMDGQFSVVLDFGEVFEGTALWLEIGVRPWDSTGAYTTLTPRQAIYAVPYAHYARNIPLAGSGSAATASRSDHDHWGASWAGSGDGLTLTSSDASAFVGSSSVIGSAGFWGISTYDSNWYVWPPAAGVIGEATNTNSNAVGVAGKGPYNGVMGFATESYGRGVDGSGYVGVSGSTYTPYGKGVQGEAWDEYGYGVYGIAEDTTTLNYGVYGESMSTNGYGGMFVSASDSSSFFGAALGAANTTQSGNTFVVWDRVESPPGTFTWYDVFHVDHDGDVYADRAYHCGLGTGSSAEPGTCIIQNSSADFAEMLPSAPGLEAGDVLVVAADGQLARSTHAYQRSVVGVYSAAAGYLGSGQHLGQEGYAPLAIVGLVQVKASAENGAILPGDLLVASGTPGHAMRAGEDPRVGTVIGKALEALEDGTGVILMLVMLQ